MTSRIKNWLRKGISKEEREKLLQAAPRKGDCCLEAPGLNEEVQATMSEQAIKRDGHFRDHQTLTGSALSTVSQVLSAILNDEEEPLDRTSILQNLANATKLLAELTFCLSEARRAFIIPGFEKDIKAVLEKTEPGEMLFGNDLLERINSAKSIAKTGKELKPQQSTFKTSHRAKYTLNWKSSPKTNEVESVNSKRSYPDKKHYTSKNYPKQRYQTRQYAQSQPSTSRSGSQR